MSVKLEWQEQATVVAWFNAKYPDLRGRLVASMNGNFLHGTPAQRKRQSQQNKAQGMAVGFPDLQLPIARHGFNGLFIEMKRTKGSNLSNEQADWLSFLAEQGYMSVVCKGAHAAIETIESYLLSCSSK